MLYMILAMVLYAAAILVGASASRNANTNLVSAVINTVSAIIPIAVAIPLLSKKVFVSHKFGLAMAALDGMLIALYVLTLTKSYSVNKVAIVTPIVFGGAIMLSSILSHFIFKERISLAEGIGLAFVLVGLIVVVYARATA